MRSLLDATREKLDAARPTLKASRYHYPPPAWLRGADPLYGAYVHGERLLRNGEVVWGHVVQANTLLFSPASGHDCPAAVLHAEDASCDHALHRLSRAAHEAYELKEKRPVAAGYKEVGAYLADEHTRGSKMPVPPGIARGRRLVITDVLIHRAALPLPYLASTFFPVLVAPDIPTVILLPAPLWADDLVEAWRDISAEAQDF